MTSEASDLDRVYAEWVSSMLSNGQVPLPESVQALSAGVYREPFDFAGMGLDPLIAAHIELLTNEPTTIARMRIARRVGRPLKYVIDNWNDEDLAAEIAWDIKESVDALKRCPDCGVDPVEYLDGDGQFLPFGSVKIAHHFCEWCAELELENKELRAGLEDDDDQPVGRMMTRPRGMGERRVERPG